jgi:hypothetical protein
MASETRLKNSIDPAFADAEGRAVIGRHHHHHGGAGLLRARLSAAQICRG